MSECEHQPSLRLSLGRAFVESVICECVHCGEVMTFPIASVPETMNETRHLQLVPPIDASRAEARGSAPSRKEL